MIDFKFPFGIKNGSLQIVGDSQSLIEQQILSVLLTKRGERVMRPNYGTGELLFNSTVDTSELTLALYRDVTTLKNVRVDSIIEESGITQVKIFYTLADTDQEILFFAEIST